MPDAQPAWTEADSARYQTLAAVAVPARDEQLATLLTLLSGNLGDLRQLVAPDSVDHDPAPGQVPGPEGYIHFFTMMRTAFPDLHITVDELIANGDMVAFAYTITGTQQGAFQGIAPTGKRISARDADVALRERPDGRALGQLRRTRHPQATRPGPDAKVTNDE